ncbi:MAG: DUF4395 domain-containing protein [Bacteroidota bacterium]
MNTAFQFGEQVEGYDIPVLNEREIRAAAGILFLVIFTAFLLIILKGDFVLAKYAITLFFTDFVIRVAISPRFSPALIIARFIVRGQVPEYVGAKQKRIAWTIGIFLSLTMLIFMIIMNSYSPVTGIVCLFCMVFLFFESAFGICLACKCYGWFYKDKAQYCPGEVCAVKDRQPIQKISLSQVLVVALFIGYIFLIADLLSDNFRVSPHNLFKKEIKSK